MTMSLYETRAACPNDMTDVELKDIGLSRCQIGAVVNGTFSR